MKFLSIQEVEEDEDTSRLIPPQHKHPFFPQCQDKSRKVNIITLYSHLPEMKIHYHNTEIKQRRPIQAQMTVIHSSQSSSKGKNNNNYNKYNLFSNP